MLIISKTHDYYDSIMKMGHDSRVTYHRVPAEDIIKVPTYRWSTDDNVVDAYKLEGNGISSEAKEQVANLFNSSKVIDIFNGDANRTFLGKPKQKGILGASRIAQTLLKSYPGYEFMHSILGLAGKVYSLFHFRKTNVGVLDNHWQVLAEKTLLKHFEDSNYIVGEIDVDATELFKSLAAPIFIFCGSYITNLGRYYYGSKYCLSTNVTLKEYGIQKMIDPYTAYQELHSFVATFMSEPMMAEVDDKSLAASKGFDNYSFKKLPTKKR